MIHVTVRTASAFHQLANNYFTDDSFQISWPWLITMAAFIAGFIATGVVIRVIHLKRRMAFIGKNIALVDPNTEEKALKAFLDSERNEYSAWGAVAATLTFMGLI